jgi:hypothetical protein
MDVCGRIGVTVDVPTPPEVMLHSRAGIAWRIGYAAAACGRSTDPLDYYPDGMCRLSERQGFKDGVKTQQLRAADAAARQVLS